MTEPLLRVSGLTLRLPSGKRDVHSILRGISLDIADGEAVGIVGESGSGKSMFARCVLGLLPDPATVAGSISFQGNELIGASERSLRRIRGSRIGYIPQDPVAAFNPTLTVGRQIAEPLEFHPVIDGSRGSPTPQEMLRSVLISDPDRRAQQHPHQMSGGMLQRALIASAVSLRPSLLVADEPTTGLDVTTQAGVMKLLRTIRAETDMALLFISHDLALVSNVCTRIMVLYRGEVVELGPAGDIVGSPRHEYTRSLVAATPRLHSALRDSSL